MSSKIWRGLRDFLLPERSSDQLCPSPAEALIDAQSLILGLAAQIDAHAAKAPYPHVARQLRQMSAEKQVSAQNLKAIIESMGERPRQPMNEPRLGQNHWQDLTLDLQDQIALEDYLLQQQSRVRGAAGVADILRELREKQAPHRRKLTALIGAADPQAHQAR